MNKLTATLKIEEYVNTILTEREQKIADYTDLVNRADTAIEAANDAMDEAELSGDEKGYQDARRDRADAMASKELHQKRLARLLNEPLITQDNYESWVNSIYAEVADIDTQARGIIARQSVKMAHIADELKETFEKANEVLRRLQSDVYKDADRSKNTSGEIMKLPHETKNVDKWDTFNWGKAGVSHYEYSKYLKEVEQ